MLKSVRERETERQRHRERETKRGRDRQETEGLYIQDLVCNALAFSYDDANQKLLW